MSGAESEGRDNLAIGSVDRCHFRGIASSGGGPVGADRFIADSGRIVGSVRLAVASPEGASPIPNSLSVVTR